MGKVNFLLVGNGGREHAIAESVCRNPDTVLFAYMSARNPGIVSICKESGGEYAIGDIHNPKAVAKWAKEKGIQLAFPSPDAVLEAGVTDALIANEIPCASPTREAARLEWDKSFARNLMKKYKIPGCPKFGVFDSNVPAARFIDELHGKVAVKPAGLTAGKGVKVTGYQLKGANDAKGYACEVLREGIGGIPKVIIEEKLEGEEFTFQAFVDGKTVFGMPLVQDHKRAYEGDVGPNCYSEDTEILTENGWKTFDGINQTEKVAIFQPRFRRIRFEKPKSIYWKKYHGKMIRFMHREIDLLVTPNHRMLTEPRKGKTRRLEVIEAKNWIGERFILQTGRWIGTSRRYFTIPKSTNRYGPKANSISIKFADWAAFLGLFLSEGYVAGPPSVRGGRVYICQSRKSKNFRKMRRILSRLPFSSKDDKKGFRINSSQLSNYLKQFGHSHEKSVPSYIKNASPSIIRIFLDAYCLGDGDIHRGQMRLCSSSKRMIDDFQELFMKIGSVGIITTDKRKTMLNPINKKHYPARPIYSIEINMRTKVSIRKNNIKELNYSGYIGCVTVSTGFIVVRRNNRVAICGNTGGMGSYSTGLMLPFLEPDDYQQSHAIMKKTIDSFLKETGKPFIGVLYGGFIATKKGVKVVEFNARFGDPEAMNVLSVFDGNLLGVFQGMAQGNISRENISFLHQATVCKYIVPEGYPSKPVPSQPLEIDYGKIAKTGAKLYFASVDEREGKIYTGSSRNIGIVGIADEIAEAERIAEGACSFVSGKVWHRKDIGTKGLVEKRIRHMNELRKKKQ